MIYNVNSDIKLNKKILKSNLCHCSDAYILIEGRTTITGAGADDAEIQANKIDKGIIIKNCVPFINCKTEINNKGIYHGKIIDIVMPMYKKYSIVIIIQKNLEVYGNITDMSQMIT